MEAVSGFSWALLVASFLLGLRHGIDWDHIAAITDITSSQDQPRRALWYSTLYALGHGSVVIFLGALLILLNVAVPDWVEALMEKVVGATLVVLGIWVFVSLLRRGADFRLRSRWMLLFAAVRKMVLTVQARLTGQDLPSSDPDNAPFANYGVRTSLGVGALHGVGAETPTQVLIFLAAAGAGGRGIGLATLIAFVLGIITMNSLLALGAVFGFFSASRSRTIYLSTGVVVGVFSMAIGTMFLFGLGDFLPALS
ncbi:MAG: hypothetical protein ACE5F5_01525 [Acidimicrobiia bacterium]